MDPFKKAQVLTRVFHGGGINFSRMGIKRLRWIIRIFQRMSPINPARLRTSNSMKNVFFIYMHDNKVTAS